MTVTPASIHLKFKKKKKKTGLDAWELNSEPNSGNTELLVFAIAT